MQGFGRGSAEARIVDGGVHVVDGDAGVPQAVPERGEAGGVGVGVGEGPSFDVDPGDALQRQ